MVIWRRTSKKYTITAELRRRDAVVLSELVPVIVGGLLVMGTLSNKEFLVK